MSPPSMALAIPYASAASIATPAYLRAEIARRLRLSKNTVAKRADMEDLFPEPPLPADTPHPATDAHAGWIEGMLEADLAPAQALESSK